MVFGLHNYWLAEKEDAWYMNPHLYRDPNGDSGRPVLEIETDYGEQDVGQLQTRIEAFIEQIS